MRHYSKNAMANSIQPYFLQLLPPTQDFTCSSTAHSECVYNIITELLDKYSSIFSEPGALPPPRPLHDHRIPLEFGENPINIRPYRYPLKQEILLRNLSKKC